MGTSTLQFPGCGALLRLFPVRANYHCIKQVSALFFQFGKNIEHLVVLMAKITNRDNSETPEYGSVRSPEQLGRLFRAARKAEGLTLHDVHAASGLSMRFLSEFERGKPNVSLAKVMAALQVLGLECLVFNRRDASQLLAQRPARALGGEV